MLDNLQTDSSIETEGDSLGGFIIDTGLYPMAVDMAYFDKAASGAISLNLSFKDQNGNQMREQLWVTSGIAKGGKNYYEKDDVKHYLPGFNVANAIANLSIAKDIGALTPEKKTIKVYDYTAKKELPQEKEVLMELIGAEVTLGIVRQVVDKNVKNATGDYVPSGDTREENVIDKVFRTKDGMTSAEIRAGDTEPKFMAAWEEKNKGKTRNKAKGAVAGNTGAAGTPGGDTKSLFS